jgi:small subunit ribosomal protein S13
MVRFHLLVSIKSMRIKETHCNEEQKLSLALCSIFGINTATAKKICAMIGVNCQVKLKRVRFRLIEKLKRICRDEIPATLFRRIRTNIKELIDMRHYKGVRHMFGLPSRGQRTRTNAQTSKKLSIVKKQGSKGKPSRVACAEQTKRNNGKQLVRGKPKKK